MRSALLALLLTGCTLAPKQAPIESPVSEAWPAPPEGFAAPDVRADARIGWREMFDDPRLHRLVETALDNNRDLRRTALAVEQARAAFKVQRSQLLPGVSASGGYSINRTPAAVSPFGEAFSIERYEVGLTLPAFELDLFGRLRSLTAAAADRADASAEAWRAARIGLVGTVMTTYLAERSAAERLAIAERTLETREQALELARQRFEAGITSELELRQYETLVASAEVSVATLARQRAQLENALVLLAGAPVEDLPAPTPLAAQDVATDLPAGLPSDLLQARPDLRAAEYRLAAANADIGAARAAFFPRIALTGSAGTASSQIGELFSAGTGTWAFAPQIVQPLFQWGRNRANLDLAALRKHDAVAAYEGAIQVAFREVADALAARATFDAQIAAQVRLRDAQAERLALAEQRYEAGVSSFLEVLDAQRALFDAEQALVQARQLRLTNAVDLYRALGADMTDPEAATADAG